MEDRLIEDIATIILINPRYQNEIVAAFKHRRADDVNRALVALVEIGMVEAVFTLQGTLFKALAAGEVGSSR